MPTPTPKLGIPKPLGNETVSRAAFNTIYDTIDQNAQKNIYQGSTAPASPIEGDIWIDTSVTPNVLKRYSAGAWVQVGIASATDIHAARTDQPNTFTANQTAPQWISTAPQGTPPLQVSSSTQIANLNASMVGGLLASQLARVDQANTFARDQTFSGLIVPNGKIAGIPNPIGYNLLPNSSFRLGSAFWVDNSSGVLAVAGNDQTGGMLGLKTNVTGSNAYWESIKIPITIIQTMTLSADMSASGVTSGAMVIQVVAYDSAGNYLGAPLSIQAPNGMNWLRYSASFTPPSNAAYLTVRAALSGATATVNQVGWRRIKLELGSVATPYTAEADLWPMLTHGVGGSPIIFPGVTSGYKIQAGYGSISVSANTATYTTVPFSMAFTSAPLVIASIATTSGFTSTPGYRVLNVSSWTTTSFNLSAESVVTETIGFNWIAIGD